MSDRPWYQIASDVYQLNHFILTVDYYSKWPGIRPEIRISKKLSLLQVVKSLKSMCSRYGITYELVSNSGPQYANKDFKDFAKDYGFTHITLSPLYPKSNGQAENIVQTVKRILKKIRTRTKH